MQKTLMIITLSASSFFSFFFSSYLQWSMTNSNSGLPTNHLKFEFFKKLPVPLFYELRNFLERHCYYKLVTSARTLEPILRETLMVYLKNPDEYESILSRIQNPGAQLIINTHVSRNEEEDNRLITAPSYKLILGKAVTNWKLLSERHAVIHSEDYSSIESFKGISDHLKELSIKSWGQLKDVSGLSHLTKLSLSSCPQLVDVHCLKNIPSLSLFYCSAISDVSSLGGVDELTLFECLRVMDISQLRNNKKLTILWCININKTTIKLQSSVRYLHTDLLADYEDTVALTAGLTNCYSMHLNKYCDWLVFINSPNLRKISIEYHLKQSMRSFDFSDFSHLFSLSVSDFPWKDIDLRPLFFVPNVTLRSLEIISLDGLGGNKMVSVSNCKQLNDFSAIRNVPHVILYSCDRLVNGKGLEGVNDLTIDNCSAFCDTSALKNVKHLSLLFCVSLVELKELQIVSTVTIRGCPQLETFDGLENNEKLILHQKDLEVLKANPKICLDSYEICPSCTDKNELIFLKKGTVVN
jgi:hypothetical protein